MERTFVGNLVCQRFPYSKTYRRFLERKLAGWSSSRFLGRAPRGLYYEATISRGPVEDQYDCEIALTSRSDVWLGFGWGDRPEAAIESAVAHLASRSREQAGSAQPRASA